MNLARVADYAQTAFSPLEIIALAVATWLELLRIQIGGVIVLNNFADKCTISGVGLDF